MEIKILLSKTFQIKNFFLAFQIKFWTEFRGSIAISPTKCLAFTSGELNIYAIASKEWMNRDLTSMLYFHVVTVQS